MKKCPFCGNEITLEYVGGGLWDVNHKNPESCGLVIQLSTYDPKNQTDEKIAELWNSRANVDGAIR